MLSLFLLVTCIRRFAFSKFLFYIVFLAFIQMASAEEDITGLRETSSDDEDYSYEDEITDTEASVQGNISGKRGPYSKRKMRGIYLVYFLFMTL